MQKMLPRRSITALCCASLVALLPARLTAAPGDLITNVPLPVAGFGVSVGVDCDGNVYYTLQNDPHLYKMDKLGNLLASPVVTDSASGAALAMDEMAWDNGRKIFWAQQHNSHPIRVYKLDPATGIATFSFTSVSDNPASTFCDGIAYDASDDTLWISADISTTVEHYRACDGVLLGQIIPKNAVGGALGSISGVIVGVGDQLYLGQDGFKQIVRVRKSDGGFIASFASPGGVRDEGLECDAVNFAPKLVLWSRDAGDFGPTPGFMAVIELEPGTCACQSACPGDITVCNDAGVCGAVVTYTPNGTNTTCSPPSGSFFPVGSTTVTCTNVNLLCASNVVSTCSFTITVKDCEAPVASCVQGPNPSGQNIPPAGDNPRSGQNPDGFYQLLAKDNCDASPKLFIKDSASSFVAGPFASGDTVKITQAPGGTPNQKPGAGVVVAHIQLKGDALLYAVDASGNVGATVLCKVPPPPK